MHIAEAMMHSCIFGHPEITPLCTSLHLYILSPPAWHQCRGIDIVPGRSQLETTYTRIREIRWGANKGERKLEECVMLMRLRVPIHNVRCRLCQLASLHSRGHKPWDPCICKSHGHCCNTYHTVFTQGRRKKHIDTHDLEWVA